MWTCFGLLDEVKRETWKSHLGKLTECRWGGRQDFIYINTVSTNCCWGAIEWTFNKIFILSCK